MPEYISCKVCFIVIPMLLLFVTKNSNATVELTNIDCKSVDKPFADFEYCYLKSINRTYKYLSLKVKLFQVPITNVSISLDFMKRANGYKPFLYSFTVDACKFLREKTNPVFRYFYGFYESKSNMNHTCPYDHDLIVNKVDIGFLDNRLTKMLPLPDGEYAAFTKWIAYNKVRALVNIYAKIQS